MRRPFFAFAILLLLTCSVSWGASAADMKLAEGTQNATLTFLMPQPITMASCTVSCYLDPTITCTSQVGDCHHPTPKGFEWITCDGHSQACPVL